MNQSPSPLILNNQDIIDYSINNKITWQELLLFELKSFIGRHFFRKRKLPTIKSELKLLHIGCGFHPNFPDWVNADFFCGFQLKNNNLSSPDWMIDLRYPLICPDNFWDGVFTEHTLEHLYPDQVFNLLQEIHRTMRSQAWLRITVPDLQKYVDYYERRIVNPVFSRWPTGCEAIHSLTQNHRHLSVWDEQLLARFLKNAGFINIQKVAFQEGNDRRICLDQAVRQDETLYMEAQKP